MSKIFKIDSLPFIGRKCDVLKADKHAIVQEFDRGKTYQVKCKEGRSLFGPFNDKGGFAICKDGEYQIKRVKIGDRAPSCVGKYGVNVNICSDHSLASILIRLSFT